MIPLRTKTELGLFNKINLYFAKFDVNSNNYLLPAACTTCN